MSDRERIRTVYRLDVAEKAFRYVQGARRRKGIEPHACLMGGEAFMAIGKSFATHENVKHSSREFVRDAAHVNSVGGFKSRVRRTIAGVFHHIISAPSMPCLSTRSASAGHSALLRARQCGYWSRVPPALRLLQVFRAITGRQCAEVRMPGLSLNLPVFCDKAALFSGSQQRVRRRRADLTGAAIGDSCHYPGIGGPINPTIEEIMSIFAS